MTWGNGRSYSEPRLSTDVLAKLESSVNLILQSVACKYNAVCSRGSCDAVSASSSHTSEILSLTWMGSCSVPSRRSSHLSWGPGAHASSGGPRSSFKCGPCPSQAPARSRLPPWTWLWLFFFLSTCYYILSGTTLVCSWALRESLGPIPCAIFGGRISHALKIHPKYKPPVVRWRRTRECEDDTTSTVRSAGWGGGRACQRTPGVLITAGNQPSSSFSWHCIYMKWQALIKPVVIITSLDVKQTLLVYTSCVYSTAL